jgi:hypothetical protein
LWQPLPVQSAWNRAGAGLALKFSPRIEDCGGLLSFWALAAGTPHTHSVAAIATAPHQDAPLVGRFITGNQPSLPAPIANHRANPVFNP